MRRKLLLLVYGRSKPLCIAILLVVPPPRTSSFTSEVLRSLASFNGSTR